MKKNIPFLAAFSVFLTVFFISCKPKSEAREILKAGFLNGPSFVPAASLVENNPDLEYQVFSGADTEIPKLLKGEIDLGVLPPNVAAKVYNQTNGNIVLLAVVGEGNVSLLTTDPACKSLEDLRGKEISCAGRGATPDYMFRYILAKNNMDFTEGTAKNGSQVFLKYDIPNPELAGALIAGKTEYILVPEPFATVAQVKGKNLSVQIVLTLTDEYKKTETGGENFPMTVLVANKTAFNKKEKEISKFLSAYKSAVLWTNENPKKAGVLVEKQAVGLNAEVTELSIPNGAYCFKTAKKSRNEVESLLKIFLEQNPESIGGRLPDESFYAK